MGGEFTQTDRDMLREVHTRNVENNTLLKTYGPRIEKLEKEDKVLHARVTRLSVITATITGAFSTLSMWFKIKYTGG